MIPRREFLRKSRLAAMGAVFGGALSKLFPEVGLASASPAQPGLEAVSASFHQVGPNGTSPGNSTCPGNYTFANRDVSPGPRSSISF
jgi:hypothetical protein